MPDLKIDNTWRDVAEASGLVGGDVFIQPKGFRCVVQFGPNQPAPGTPADYSIDGVSVDSYQKLPIRDEPNIWVRTLSDGQITRLHIAEFVV